MICKTCGTNVPDGSAYCRTCGAPMAAEPAAPATPVCAYCGAPLTPGGMFCTNCGHQQPAEAPVPPVAPAAPAEPFAPAAPAAPAEPFAPAAPAAPAEPFAPAAPVAPACVYCGTPLPEGSVFCTNCGNQQPTGVPVPPAAPAAPKEKKPFPMKLVLIGAGALTLIVALIIILTSCGGNSPEAVAEEFVECMYGGDIEGALNLMPEEVLDYISEEEDMDLDEMIEDMEDEMDDAMDLVDIEYTIEEVGEAEYYKKKDLKNLRENYEDMDIEIEDAAEVEVTMLVEAYGMEMPQDMTIVVIQVDGDWYVDMSSMDRMGL